jgi:hypothetical protein
VAPRPAVRFVLAQHADRDATKVGLSFREAIENRPGGGVLLGLLSEPDAADAQVGTGVVGLGALDVIWRAIWAWLRADQTKPSVVQS